MAVNKVEYGGETLIDLTEDSVTPETMIKGATAHNSAGEPIEGTFDPDIYQPKTDETLETESKIVVGAINEVNAKTVDKIIEVHTDYGSMQEISDDGNGLSWANTIHFRGIHDVDEGRTIYQKIPISAGKNVTLEADATNRVFTINTKPTNVAVSTDYPSVMEEIITAIQEAGGNIAEVNFVSFSGYLEGFVAIKFKHYGGTTYQVECVDINNVANIYNPETNNVIDVSTTRIGVFLSYTVNNGLPSYTAENNGQFLSIVDGEATWVDLPVAEDIVITIAEEITFNE